MAQFIWAMGRAGGLLPVRVSYRLSIPICLHRRALDRAIRTEHAAVTWLGPKQGTTACALVEIEARINRHDRDCREPTIRTCEDGLEDQWRLHRMATNGRRGSGPILASLELILGTADTSVRLASRPDGSQVASLRAAEDDWDVYRVLSMWIFHTPAGALPDFPAGVPAAASLRGR